MDNKMASFGGRREFQRKSHWKFFLFLIFLTAFLVSGGLLLRNLYRSQQEQAAYDALAEQVHQMEKQIAEAGGGARLQRTAFFHSIRRCGRKIRIWPDGFPLKERQSTTP